MSNGYSSPDDPEDLVSMRGGGYLNFGMNCRSVVRYEVRMGIFGRYLGLRLALRCGGRSPDSDERKERE